MRQFPSAQPISDTLLKSQVAAAQSSTQQVPGGMMVAGPGGADEPTGNLDSATEDEILGVFTSLAYDEGKCVIIVTHSKIVTTIADAIYGMSDGKMVQMKRRD